MTSWPPRLADAGLHPNPAKAADGRRLRKLEPDHRLVEHPAAVYVCEDLVAGPLDAWLAAAFHPGVVAARLEGVQNDQAIDVKVEAARRELADCDRLLVRHRAALEAGAEPVLVAEWDAGCSEPS